MAGGWLSLLRDRARKAGLYDSAAYWDGKARSYRGLARSAWPSNAYNARLHERQMRLIDEALGDVTGLQVVDVGCGTGRASLHLARRGARVTGLDFSAAAVQSAKEEAEALGLAARFEVADVRAPFDARHHEAYDAALVLGCLTLACRDERELAAALRRVAGLIRPGGRALFIEPIHTARLTARLLRLSTSRWVELASEVGLKLCGRRGLLFVPTRYLLAFRELPEPLVARVFAAGERALDALGEPDALADYKALWFDRLGMPGGR